MTKFDNSRIEEIVLAFLQLAPAFASQWNEYLAQNRSEERPQYIDVAEIARFIVFSFRDGNTDQFPKVFSAIEEWLKREDPKFVELITIGLLEDVQTLASQQPFGTKPFEKWLGPVSKSRWDSISKTWEGKSSIMDVYRAEMQARGGKDGGGA